MDQTIALELRIAQTVSLLQEIEHEHSPAALASSLGVEDMVLTDLIVKHAPGIEIFTLDTGRLHSETYDLLQRVTDHYQTRIRIFAPAASRLEQFVGTEGINAFYRSAELRKECCEIRKVEPLRRALAGKEAWITGMRREQAVTRRDLPEREYDSVNRLRKFNPLADWLEDDVWAYVRQFGVPYNGLHDKGFPSIGCQPCTRALAPGEDVRSGRWWWENPETKECGLHVRKG
jgi:phosphoadenosine phosphosulfate reductase